MSEPTPMTPDELKTCPFCGCESSMNAHGAIFRDGSGVGYRVECAGKCHAMTCYWHTEAEAMMHWNARAAPAARPQEADYKALYFELLYEVATKHPNESRHETARRYIRRAETPSDNQVSACAKTSLTETRPPV